MAALGDRFALALLRLVAKLMMAIGVSVLIAAMSTSAFTQAPAILESVAGILVQIGFVLVASGGTALYLSRRGGWQLPNERTSIDADARPAVGGWLVALTVVLIGQSIWVTWRSMPFLAECRDVIAFLAGLDIWDTANANMSGIVLVPVAGALTPPAQELVAILALVLSPALLLPLLLLRREAFPRAYLICCVLLTAMVVGALRGATGAMLVTDAVQELIRTWAATDAERTELMGGVSRYISLVASIRPTLIVALPVYLVWLPAVILSSRTRMTFARAVQRPDSAPQPLTLEAITRPPHLPD
jgi:hypothetical protein